MAKESIYGIGKEPIFRETFNDQQTVERNGGVITDVTFNEGNGSFNGSTSFISYPKRDFSNNIVSFEIRVKINENKIQRIVGTADIGQVENGIVLETISGNLYFGIAQGLTANLALKTAIFNEWIHVIGVCDGVNNHIYINNEIGTSNVINGNGVAAELLTIANDIQATRRGNFDIDYFNIYNYALTAADVSNLYNNSRYQELNLAPILNLTAQNGIIEDKAGNNFTNTDVEVVRDGQIYSQKCNGTTSTLQLSSSINLGTQFSFLVWVKLKYKGDFQAFAGYSNLSYPLTYRDTTESLFVHDGTGSVNTGNIGYDSNEWGLLGCTKNGVVVNFYFNGKNIDTKNFASSNDIIIDRLYQRGSGFFVVGKIGETFIFNSVFSDEQISQLYNSTKFKYIG